MRGGPHRIANPMANAAAISLQPKLVSDPPVG